MNFVFDVKKAVAAAAFLCGRSATGSLDVIRLIKMLYLAERQALLSWQRPITGDRFYSLDNGPILSRVYDLIQSRVTGSDMDEWRKTFAPREGNSVKLTAPVDLDPLSRRETQALGEAYEQLVDLPVSLMIRRLHELLPEWQNPLGSSVLIPPESILALAGHSETEIAELTLEIDSLQSAKLEFQGA